jgi:hypothetical protein
MREGTERRKEATGARFAAKDFDNDDENDYDSGGNRKKRAAYFWV